MNFHIPTDADKSTCRGCGSTIFWIETVAGKKMPVDPDGISHFATCPEALRFRKKKEKAHA